MPQFGQDVREKGEIELKAKITSAVEAEQLMVLGLPHAVLVETNETPSGYEMLEITGTEGLGVPLHVHQNEDETFYVAEGKVAFLRSDGEQIGTAGTCVNLPRGEPHGFRILTPDTRMVFIVAPGNLLPMFRELANLPPGEPDLDEVSRIVGQFDIAFA